MTVRLYLDEDISPLLASLLRQAGFDAVSALDLHPSQLTDDDHLRRATEDSRGVLSYNHHDFTRIAAEWSDNGLVHSGIIVSYKQYTNDEVVLLVQAMEALFRGRGTEEVTNAFLVLPRLMRS